MIYPGGTTLAHMITPGVLPWPTRSNKQSRTVTSVDALPMATPYLSIWVVKCMCMCVCVHVSPCVCVCICCIIFNAYVTYVCAFASTHIRVCVCFAPSPPFSPRMYACVDMHVCMICSKQQWDGPSIYLVNAHL